MEIAEESGLPKANILYYFRSKEDIYCAVCQDILETWLSALGDISAEDKPYDALKNYIKAKMDLSRQRLMLPKSSPWKSSPGSCDRRLSCQ